MKKIIYGAIIFAAGVVVGNLVTSELIGAKYRKLADDEINSYKEYYDSKYSKKDAVEEVIKEEPEEPEEANEEVTKKDADRREYENVLKNSGYVSKGSEDNTNGKEPVTVEDENNFIIITPEEFGEIDEKTGEVFDMVTLVYYADNVMLYYEDQHQVDDIDHLVGEDFRDHFGDYEEGVVYVRNIRNQTDYEIIKEEDEYYDIFDRKDEVGRMNDTR